MLTIYNTNFLNYLEGLPGSPPTGIVAGTAGILSGVLAGGGSVATLNHGAVLWLYCANGNALPTNPDTFWDATKYTLLAPVLANPGSGYGLTFAAAAGGILAKNGGETWGTGTLPGHYVAGLNYNTANNLTIDFAVFANLWAGDTDGSANTPSGCPRILMDAGTIGAGVYAMPLVSNILAKNGSLTFSGGQFS